MSKSRAHVAALASAALIASSLMAVAASSPGQAAVSKPKPVQAKGSVPAVHSGVSDAVRDLPVVRASGHKRVAVTNETI